MLRDPAKEVMERAYARWAPVADGDRRNCGR